MEFTKHDKEKPQMVYLGDLSYELGEVARVLSYGAQKYGRNNWKRCYEPERYISAGLRHMLEYAGGAYNDTESGLPHAAHVVCNMLFAMAIQAKNGEDKDE